MRSVARDQVGRLPRSATGSLAPCEDNGRGGGPVRGVRGANAEWFFDADAGAIFDSNLTGAPSGPDVRSGWAAAVDASVGPVLRTFRRRRPDAGGQCPRRGLRSLPRAQSGGDRRLGALSAQVRARARRAVGIACGEQLVRRLSQRRPRWRALRRARRIRNSAFTESIDVVAGVAYDRRYGPHGEAIVPGYLGRGLQPHRSQCVLPGRLHDRRSLVAQSSTAPFVAATSNPRRSREMAVFLASTAIAPDPAFNDPNLYAYRLPGTTWTLGATSSYALDDHARRSTFSTRMRSPTRHRISSTGAISSESCMCIVSRKTA